MERLGRGRRTCRVAPSTMPSCSAVSRVTCAQTSLVVDQHVDPHLEAEPRHPDDGRGRGRRVRLVEQLEVVRPHQRGRPASVTGPRKLITKSFAGCVVELVGRADLLDLAVGHHHDAVGDVHRLLLVVGDEHGGHVDLVVQPAQPGAQLLAHLGVERAERLVEQQHLRLDRERPGQRHALALAAGELRGVAGRRTARGARARAARCTRSLISALGRLRISSPKATLREHVMCLNAA